MQLTPPIHTVTSFLTDDIFDLIGLSSLSDEEKAAYMATMRDTVVARAYERITTEYLTPSEVAETNALPAGEFFKFLQDKGVAFVDVLLEEATSYRAQIVAQFRVATASYDQLVDLAVAP